MSEINDWQEAPSQVDDWQDTSTKSTHHGLVKRTPNGKINPLPEDPWIRDAAVNAGMGPASQAAGQGVNTLIGLLGKGLNKGGDFLMQKAVGLKKYIPGLGETLGEEGLVGTRGMMQGQVEKGLATRGQEIGNLSKGLKEVSTQPVAEQLGGRAAKLTSSEGEVLPDNIKQYHQYIDQATKASQEGAVSGETAAFRRKQYGDIARNSGRYRDNPAQGFKAQMAGDQQAGYSQALKQSYAKANPLNPNALAEADKAYSGLSRASTALDQPPSLSPYAMLKKLLAPAIGGAVGGLPGAVAGTALSTPAGMSVAGRAALGVGNALTSPASQAIGKQVPVSLAELLGKKEESRRDE